MATYCIGDVQGCFDELEELLKLINYNHNEDSLWFAGDLVNRGPKSLEVLRLLYDLPNIKIVLGNHDLHLLTFYNRIVDFEAEHLEDILIAPDGEKLINWLRKKPLVYHSPEHNAVMAHAGIYPGWDVEDAIKYSKEVEKVLQSDNYVDFLEHMYGEKPNSWDNNLTGWERLRFIVSVFTCMRLCNLEGELDLKYKGPLAADAPTNNYLPWFKIPWRKTKDIRIIFGHWAALKGVTNETNVHAVDTGCVWKESLTALRLEDETRFSLPCPGGQV